MTEKTTEIVQDVLAGHPSKVVDAIGSMVQARAAELLRAKYVAGPSLDDEEEENEDKPEGEESDDEETK